MCLRDASSFHFFIRFSVLFLPEPLPWNLWERYLKEDEIVTTRTTFTRNFM